MFENKDNMYINLSLFLFWKIERSDDDNDEELSELCENTLR